METFFNFLNEVMIALFETDHLFTYDYLVAELHMSRTILSGIKHGRDLKLHHYIHVVSHMANIIRLTIFLAVLLKLIKIVLIDHKDLVAAVVSHGCSGNSIVESWMVVLKWE